jgi:hypothetical protein
MPIIGWEQRFEDSSGLHEFSREGATLDDYAYRGRVRLNRANDNAGAFDGVRAEETKRLAMFCSRKRGKLHLQVGRRFAWYALTGIFRHFGQVNAPLPM